MLHVHPFRSLSMLAQLAIVFEILLGVGAVAGGVALMIGRHGEIIPLPVSMLAGSPFPDYFVPGAILFSVIGLGPLVVALLAWRGNPWAPVLTLAVGGALLIWLLVQFAVVGYQSDPPVQLVYLVFGAMITLTGLAWTALAGVPLHAFGGVRQAR